MKTQCVTFFSGNLGSTCVMSWLLKILYHRSLNEKEIRSGSMFLDDHNLGLRNPLIFAPHFFQPGRPAGWVFTCFYVKLVGNGSNQWSTYHGWSEVHSEHFKAWLVVWLPFFIFPYNWEFHHPNWRTHIFQRGSFWPTNQKAFVPQVFLGLVFWASPMVSPETPQPVGPGDVRAAADCVGMGQRLNGLIRDPLRMGESWWKNHG